MEKANKFFFLSSVNDHILADFRRFDANTVIQFRHENDHSGDRLALEIIRQPRSQFFVIEYSIVHDNKEVSAGRSDAIHALEVYGVIAGLANESIPEVWK